MGSQDRVSFLKTSLLEQQLLPFHYIAKLQHYRDRNMKSQEYIDSLANRNFQLILQHSHIFSAKESFIDPELLFKELDNLEIALNSLDITKSLNIMSKLVSEWKSKF